MNQTSNIKTASTHTDNVKGIVYMVLSMASFTLADMNLKLASATVSIGQLILVLGIGSSLLLWFLLRRKKLPVFTPSMKETAVILRTLGEITATIFIVMALTYTSFTNVTVIIQSLPLVITLAAYLFLGESVGWHRMSAVLIGFVGMLLIVNPASDGFDVYSLLAIAAVLGMTLRDLGSRLAGAHHSTVRLTLFGAFSQIIAGLGIMAFETDHVWPNLQASIHLLWLVLFASIGTVLITLAMRTGEVSAVAPFRYTRLIFGVIVGVVVFSEQLNGYTVTGSVIIIVCGLYVWQRERMRRQQNPSTAVAP